MIKQADCRCEMRPFDGYIFGREVKVFTGDETLNRQRRAIFDLGFDNLKRIGL